MLYPHPSITLSSTEKIADLEGRSYQHFLISALQQSKLGLHAEQAGNLGTSEFADVMARSHILLTGLAPDPSERKNDSHC